jgi:putative two-component system response regulator
MNRRPALGVAAMWRKGSSTEARILIVDDEEANVRLLERALAHAGYGNIASTTQAREVARLVAECEPDLILLDLLMPHMDGFEVMQLLESLSTRDSYLPILVLTADTSTQTRRRALASGAKDFLTKPLDLDEVLLRIRNMLEIRLLHEELRVQNESLEERVEIRTHELQESQIETFERLALAAEFRDDDTGQHTRRVGRTAFLIARTMGVASGVLEPIERAAALHDVGKIGVPDAIFLAPRKLSSEEFEVVKTHTTIGARILSGSRSALLKLAEEIAFAHHERWDGHGYAGLAGEEIPLSGRITTVADVFDALTHDRPYKRAWPVDAAVAEITRGRGRQFDPGVVDAFLGISEEAAVDLEGGSTTATEVTSSAPLRSRRRVGSR